MIDLTVRDNATLARKAASSFFWRMFRRHYLLSFALGVPMFSGMYFMSRNTPGVAWTSYFFAFFLVMMLLYVPVFYTARLWIATKIAKRHPVRHIHMTETSLTDSALGDAALPWSKFGAVWEYRDYFVLLVWKHVYWWIPKDGMSEDAMRLLRNVVTKPAA